MYVVYIALKFCGSEFSRKAGFQSFVEIFFANWCLRGLPSMGKVSRGKIFVEIISQIVPST